jgi:hypothetical protein
LKVFSFWIHAVEEAEDSAVALGVGSEIGGRLSTRLSPWDSVPAAKQLAEKVFCGGDFGFVGAPDPSAALRAGF